MKKTPVFIFALLAAVALINAAPANPLAAFKASEIYSKKYLFEGAYLNQAGNLTLVVSKKYLALDRGKREAACREAVAEWVKDSNASNTVLVEVKEAGMSVLWKADNEGKVSAIDQWGYGIGHEREKTVFMSAALDADSSTGGATLSMTFGTYLYKDIIDSALNMSVAGGTVGLGLSGRAHYLIAPKWDLNAGLMMNFSGSKGSGNFDLAFLLGAGNFLSYRSSLDITLSIATSGAVTLGSGITYYFNTMPDIEGLFGRPAATQAPTATPEATAAASLIATPAPEATEGYDTTPTPFTAMTYMPTAGPTSAVTYDQSQDIISAPLNPPTEEPAAAPTQVPTEAPAYAVYTAPAQEPSQAPTAAATSGATQAPSYTPEITATIEAFKERTMAPTPETLNAQAETPEATPGPVNTPRQEATLTQEQNGNKNADTDEEEEGPAAGLFLEGNVFAPAKISDFAFLDAQIRFGFGNGFIGASIMPEYMYYMKSTPAHYGGGINLAIELYPFGNAPAAIYLGPIGGARYYTDDMTNFYKSKLQLVYGGEAGVRALMNFLIFDMGVIYLKPIESIPGWPDEMFKNIKLYAGVGFMFYGNNGGEDGETAAPAPHEETPVNNSGFYFEGDLLNFIKGRQNDEYVASIRLGPGRDTFFAEAYTLKGSYNDSGPVKTYTAGAEAAFDIYPLGHSPAGIYFGPFISGLYFNDGHPDPHGTSMLFGGGGEAGLRLLLRHFVIDGGCAYSYSYTYAYDKVQFVSRDFTYRAGIGLMFYGN